jgi:hypothetical protein
MDFFVVVVGVVVAVVVAGAGVVATDFFTWSQAVRARDELLPMLLHTCAATSGRSSSIRSGTKWLEP